MYCRLSHTAPSETTVSQPDGLPSVSQSTSLNWQAGRPPAQQAVPDQHRQRHALVPNASQRVPLRQLQNDTTAASKQPQLQRPDAKAHGMPGPPSICRVCVHAHQLSHLHTCLLGRLCSGCRTNLQLYLCVNG